MKTGFFPYFAFQDRCKPLFPMLEWSHKCGVEKPQKPYPLNRLHGVKGVAITTCSTARKIPDFIHPQRAAPARKARPRAATEKGKRRFPPHLLPAVRKLPSGRHRPCITEGTADRPQAFALIETKKPKGPFPAARQGIPFAMIKKRRLKKTNPLLLRDGLKQLSRASLTLSDAP